MKLLYLSCHSILEFLEVSLFTELGHYCFSPGAYVEPLNPGDASLRPGLPGLEEYVNQWVADREAYHRQPVPASTAGTVFADQKYHLTKEFVDRFDAVVVMHLPEFVHRNWGAIQHKPVIWRTIGQSIESTEKQMQKYRQRGMKIVRYSPREERIPGFIGQDAMIRFYLDEREFGPWSGHVEKVITFNQAMPQRSAACSYPLWRQVVEPLPHRLYGPGNEKHKPSDTGEVMGKVGYDELKQAMRDHRAYFYVGTHPASYTLNFMEALASGIPMVAIGPKHGNASYFPGHDLYEIPDFIEHGHSGFIDDRAEELQACLEWLLEHPEKAGKIGAEGRKTAVELFGKQPIKEQWRAYLAAF